MSQEGPIDILGTFPQIPTEFVADIGSAIPILNILNILGTTQAAGTSPLHTTGSGNTITIINQLTQAAAVSAANIAGLASFSSADFSVDANGFVTLGGTSSAVEAIAMQTGTSPVVATVAGLVTFNGAVVAAGTNPVRTDGTGPNTMALEVQISQAIASTNATNIGLAAFDSASFSVDANGFVTTSGTGILKTLTGNSGGAISPTAGNINTVGTGSLTVVGSGSTLTHQLTGLTNHAVLVGAGTATITKIGPTATSGQVLQSAGSSADPAFSTATYPSTTTINQILYSSAANTVTGLATANRAVLTTGATGIPVLTALATDGQLIIGSTAGVPAAATLTAGTGISITNGSNSISIAVNGSVVGQTITGDTGGALSPTAGNWNILATSNSGSSVSFSGSASTLRLNVTDVLSNTLIGAGAGNGTLTAFRCTGLGSGVMNALTSQIDSTAVGYHALNKATSGAAGNDAYGSSCMALLTTGTTNCSYGQGSLQNLLTGSRNISMGSQSGSSYTGSESDNITIGNSGTIAESNTLRIGNQGSGGGQQNRCFIAGITGVSVSNQAITTINTSTGQLGSAAFSVVTQTFSASGTYTPTTGMKYCKVRMVGGGGGGGGAAATTAAQTSVGVGAGAGEYAEGTFSAATIGASQAVTIGAAGATNSGAAGGNGGTTSLGALITAGGGIGGATAAAAVVVNQTGALGGSGGSGGSFRSPGRAGFYASGVVSSSTLLGGEGGSSQFGAGGVGASANSVGNAALGYGSGGSGALNFTSQSARIGGAGTAGIIVIDEYVII